MVLKLKAENERLRAGAGEQVKLAAAQRAAKEARERVAAAENELVALRARVSAGDDASARLAQQKEQLAQAKRALRLRDDEVQQDDERFFVLFSFLIFFFNFS